jgi:hypothetical protein
MVRVEHAGQRTRRIGVGATRREDGLRKTYRDQPTE